VNICISLISPGMGVSVYQKDENGIEWCWRGHIEKYGYIPPAPSPLTGRLLIHAQQGRNAQPF